MSLENTVDAFCRKTLILIFKVTARLISVVFFLQMSAQGKLLTGSPSAYKQSDKGFFIVGKYHRNS